MFQSLLSSYNDDWDRAVAARSQDSPAVVLEDAMAVYCSYSNDVLTRLRSQYALGKWLRTTPDVAPDENSDWGRALRALLTVPEAGFIWLKAFDYDSGTVSHPKFLPAVVHAMRSAMIAQGQSDDEDDNAYHWRTLWFHYLQHPETGVIRDGHWGEWQFHAWVFASNMRTAWQGLDLRIDRLERLGAPIARQWTPLRAQRSSKELILTTNYQGLHLILGCIPGNCAERVFDAWRWLDFDTSWSTWSSLPWLEGPENVRLHDAALPTLV